MARIYYETTEKVRPLHVIRVQEAATSDFEKTMMDLFAILDAPFACRYNLPAQIEKRTKVIKE